MKKFKSGDYVFVTAKGLAANSHYHHYRFYLRKICKVVTVSSNMLTVTSKSLNKLDADYYTKIGVSVLAQELRKATSTEIAIARGAGELP